MSVNNFAPLAKRSRVEVDEAGPSVSLEKLTYCTKCSLDMGSYEKLLGHISMDHLDYVPYQCSFCDFLRTPTEKSLIEHLTERHPEKPIVVS